MTTAKGSFQHRPVPTTGINCALARAEISTDFSSTEAYKSCLYIHLGDIRYIGQDATFFCSPQAASHRCKHLYLLLHPKPWGSLDLLLLTYILPFGISARYHFPKVFVSHILPLGCRIWERTPRHFSLLELLVLQIIHS